MSAPTVPPLGRGRVLRPELIRQKCEYFVNVQLWPVHSRLDVRGWLANFRSEDELLATHLLNAFLAVPADFVDQMLPANFRALSRLVTNGLTTYAAKHAAWTSFVNRLIVTFPTGEEPNPTDSGPEYARRTRQQVDIDESVIVDPAAALERIAANAPAKTPVVFVDDFVGTGNQFAETWRRWYSGPLASFAEADAAGLLDAYYLPIFSSELGHRRIAADFPSVSLQPVHVLSDRYSALNPDGIVWPESLAADGIDFIERESRRAGIPDTDGATPNDWRGFGKLGLTIAIARSIPDATLPLFYWGEAGWQPLMRRA